MRKTSPGTARQPDLITDPGEIESVGEDALHVLQQENPPMPLVRQAMFRPDERLPRNLAELPAFASPNV